MEGSFLDELQANSWLSEGPSLNLAQYRQTDPEGSYEGYYINGGIGIDGSVQTVYFNNLSAAYYSWEPTCTFNATGAIGFRSTDGDWAYMFLGNESSPSCDGCGMLYSDVDRTDSLGEICLDVQSLLDNGLQSW